MKMAISKSKVYTVFLLLFFLFLSDIHSQPYYYYTINQDTALMCDIYRIDLSTGNDELFLRDAGGRYSDVSWNSDQTHLFINQRNSVIDVMKLDSLNKYQRIADDFISIVNYYDAPKINKFLIEYGNYDDETYEYTVIYDRTTYEPIDTFVFYGYGGTFLSADEKLLYKNVPDSAGVFFSAYDLQNNLLLYDYRVSEDFSRPDHMYFDKIDGKHGKALFFMSTNGYNQQKYFVVNPDSGLYFDPISIPSVRIRGYLSVNANFVITEKVNWVLDDLEANIGHQVYTGEISIYDAITGAKISDITLPPNGEILFFDNFPNMFYYFNRTDHSVVPIDLTTLEHSESGLPVKLIDSQGNLLTGGTLQYYEGSWKDAIDNGNGTFIVQTDRNTISLKMNYLDGWQQFNNVTVGTDTVVFQTINAVVQLNDSQSNLLDGGTASFYAKSWQEIGITVNGETSIELLPKEYSFRMTYNNIGNDKKQNIADNAVVVFSTIPVTVSVKNSNGDIILGAEVQYYSKQWNLIGNTDSSGEITAEMLPKNITFRVKYNSQTYDKKQDTAENSLVEFIVE